MATIVLSAAGAGIGSAIGGSFLGVSAAVIGRAFGATIGHSIDQNLLGLGSAAVETGRIERFRMSGAGEGTPIARIWGRTRVAGQVIWASRFKESVTVSEVRSGGKGAAPQGPEVREFGYSVSLAIALCEGPISMVGRIWADGNEVEPASFTMRVYDGSESQLPDSLIEAVEGDGMAPAYRGIAYVVLEDLDLGRFGNRVPQFSFEVVRAAVGVDDDLNKLVRGVSLIPGTGEYALATTPVHYSYGMGHSVPANINSPSGETDLRTALRELRGTLPEVGSVSLVVSWFCSDLRAPYAEFRPKVEQHEHDGAPIAWQVAGLSRVQAQTVPRIDDSVVYGGTPADATVIEAIQELRAGGQDVVFYPFVLMDQLSGNDLTDPYSGGSGQPHLPWRGRITLSLAPGLDGSPDGTAAAVDEVSAFFGTAQAADFTVDADTVRYSGPDGWSYRRFILHYAHLCAAAGGVDAFCIGSELRGITTVQGPDQGFPAVNALRDLAAAVRTVLGADCKIGYAADWSEYSGYQPPNAPGDRYFHLDPLWADANIDFVGIDNYMPLSDWRDGVDHADADWETIYNLDYLRANIEGGEGYDWYYPSDVERDTQSRIPITDGTYDEPWVWRYKDLRKWWQNAHHDRIGGLRRALPTEWIPCSKPIWFTEIGCPAVDKGSNAPNRFIDPKSSENALPPYSTGLRDDLLQRQYLRAVLSYWSDPERNPVSEIFGGSMIDLSRMHVWAWDARPFPYFPNNEALWSDGPNYRLGHWLNGRSSAQSLEAVVQEICGAAGLEDLGLEQLHGLVRGYSVSDAEHARAVLQPLMLANGFDVFERGGKIVFRSRRFGKAAPVLKSHLAVTENLAGQAEHIRRSETETAERVRLNFVESDGAYEIRSVEAAVTRSGSAGAKESELPLVLRTAEGQEIVERWLSEAQVSRDCLRIALPPSALDLGAGDLLDFEGGEYRIDRVNLADSLEVEAVRVERNLCVPKDVPETPVRQAPFLAPAPVYAAFLDIPSLSGEENSCAPYVAVTAAPWPGSVSIYDSVADSGYRLNSRLVRASTIGTTESSLTPAAPSRWDRGNAVRVKLSSGQLDSVPAMDLMDGANLAAIGTGSPQGWEVFQFAQAELVAPQTYDLRMLLRGQLGTETEAEKEWPPGSVFVLIDESLSQITLKRSSLGLPRHYRFGPSLREYSDFSFQHIVSSFHGFGLRPYSPAHLTHKFDSYGNVLLTWVRRTRVGGDSWASFDVPLGEERELYEVRVIGRGDETLRTEYVTSPNWQYSVEMQNKDGVTFPFVIAVAQMSGSFGAGPSLRIEIK